jgi:hypothetical protein
MQPYPVGSPATSAPTPSGVTRSPKCSTRRVCSRALCRRLGKSATSGWSGRPRVARRRCSYSTSGYVASIWFELPGDVEEVGLNTLSEAPTPTSFVDSLVSLTHKTPVSILATPSAPLFSACPSR